MDTTVGTPLELDGLTPRQLGSCLGVEVADVEVTPIAVGEGFMSEIARLTLTYATDPPDEAAPRTLVAKVPTTDPGSVELGQMLGVWEREARFYLDVAPQLPVRTATCYDARGDHRSGLWSLLLEDLADLRLGDQVAGVRTGEAEAAIDWLARFHGSAAGEPALQGLAWLPDVTTDERYTMLQPLLEGVWPQFVDTYADACPDGSLDIVERSRSRLTEMICRQPTPPTVIHADYRLDNLFFGEDGQVVPVDWQSPALGQGLYDLAYFLTSCLTVEDRRAREHELLRRWSEGVRAAGGTPPADVDLWEEYRRMVLMVMTIEALLLGQIDVSVNERAVELGRQIAHRVYRAGVDLEVDRLLDD